MKVARAADAYKLSWMLLLDKTYSASCTVQWARHPRPQSCRFSTVLTAIILLHFCKNYDITLEKLAQQIKITSDEHQEQPSQFVPVPDYRTSDSDSKGDQVHSKSSKKGNSYGSVMN